MIIKKKLDIVKEYVKVQSQIDLAFSSPPLTCFSHPLRIIYGLEAKMACLVVRPELWSFNDLKSILPDGLVPSIGILCLKYPYI